MSDNPSALPLPKIAVGDRIRVRQQIVGRDVRWGCQVEGVVESCKHEKTGSWFAHGKNDRLWLCRVRLRKDDGEITALILDERSEITVL